MHLEVDPLADLTGYAEVSMTFNRNLTVCFNYTKLISDFGGTSQICAQDDGDAENRVIR